MSEQFKTRGLAESRESPKEAMKYSLDLFYVDHIMHQMFAVKDGKRENGIKIADGIAGVFNATEHTWEITGANLSKEAILYLEKTTDPFPVRIFRLRKMLGTLYTFR